MLETQMPETENYSPEDHVAALDAAMEMLYSTYSRDELVKRDTDSLEVINENEKVKAKALRFESVETMLDLCLKAVTRLESAEVSNPRTFPPAKKDSTPLPATESLPVRPVKVANMAAVTLAIIERIVQDERAVEMKRDGEATPYYQIKVTQEGCNRHIFVNEAVSNATYIFDPDKLPPDVSIDSLMEMNKDQIFTFTKDHPECALRLIKRGNWPKRLIEALDTDLAIINAKDDQLDKLFDGSYIDTDGALWASNKTMARLKHASYTFISEAYANNIESIRTKKYRGLVLYSMEDFENTPEYIDRQSRVLGNEVDHLSFKYQGEEYITFRGLCQYFNVSKKSSFWPLTETISEADKILVYYHEGNVLKKMPAYKKRAIFSLPTFKRLEKVITIDKATKDEDGFYLVNGKRYGILRHVVEHLLPNYGELEIIRACEAVRNKIKDNGSSESPIQLRAGNGLQVDTCYLLDDARILEYINEYKPLET